MSGEYIDVPVAEVQAGDEVRLDGFGSQGSEYQGDGFHPVHGHSITTVNVGPRLEAFRRSSIVSARRRKPEPQPKPGDWRCATSHWSQEPKEVFRASGGWSRDTRAGRPWVPKRGETVEVRERHTVADVYPDGLVVLTGNCVANYTKGSNVFMVDRRGKR